MKLSFFCIICSFDSCFRVSEFWISLIKQPVIRSSTLLLIPQPQRFRRTKLKMDIAAVYILLFTQGNQFHTLEFLDLSYQSCRALSNLLAPPWSFGPSPLLLCLETDSVWLHCCPHSHQAHLFLLIPQIHLSPLILCCSSSALVSPPSSPRASKSLVPLWSTAPPSSPQFSGLTGATTVSWLARSRVFRDVA